MGASRLSKILKIISAMALCLPMLLSASMNINANATYLLPYEDADLGRNSNAYLSIYGTPSPQIKHEFVNEITSHAIVASEKWGVPASAIIGMAILESGFGTTRIAIHANNIFGIKKWGYNPTNAWQLKGQPSEDYEEIPILANYGPDRIVYDESQRRDNWYRMFSSYEEAIDYLAGTLLLNQRYGFALTNYENRIKNGWTYARASKEYLYDVANAGYNHLGGDYYRNKAGNIMEEWNLFQYDVKGPFKDIIGHWAEDQILFAADNDWVNGYPDQTFKPNNRLTRAQAASIMANFLNLKSTSTTISFDDVSSDFWAKNPIQLVAQNGLMNGTGDGIFSPNTTLTRAQMAQIFYNAFFTDQQVSNARNSFEDISNSHWAYAAIETMKQEGIMSGYGDGTFKPNQPLTRAQMAAVIYKLDRKELAY